MHFSTTTTSAAVLALLATIALANDNCIILKGDDSYTWKGDGAFSGSGNIDNQQHCFGSGGGGISIGHPKAPQKGMSGNTRIECFFPENESDASFFNCNLSLVDGFSAAVTCETQGGGWPNSKNESAPLGCGYDLMDGCPDNLKDGSAGVCKNEKGAHVSDLNAVDPAFHPCKMSDEYPNTAELYFNMEGAFMFKKSDFPLTCEVGKGKKAPGGMKVRSVEGGQQQQQHGHAAGHVGKRNPLHTRHVHARGLLDMVS